MIRSARAARRDRADVVATQRRRAAGGCGPDRLVDGHVHVSNGQGDAERHRCRVARARVAVRRQRSNSSGGEQPAGVGIRLARREVGGRQERGHGAAAGERGDVVVVEIGAVVGRRAPELDGQLDARSVTELVGVQSQCRARRRGPRAARHATGRRRTRRARRTHRSIENAEHRPPTSRRRPVRRSRRRGHRTRAAPRGRRETWSRRSAGRRRPACVPRRAW